jgi:hypothetical protein
MIIPNYCSLQPYVWTPIRRDRSPSTITWHQIKRQQREYGKKNRRKNREIIQKREHQVNIFQL